MGVRTGDVGHPLDLPIDAAERLGDVGIDAAFVAPELTGLADQEEELRAEDRVVDAGLGGEGGGVDLRPFRFDVLVELPFGGERIGAPVAEPAADLEQAWVVAIAAEVRRRDRIELERLEEVAVPEGEEGRVLAGRVTPAAAGKAGQETEGEGSLTGADQEVTAVHGWPGWGDGDSGSEFDGVIQR